MDAKHKAHNIIRCDSDGVHLSVDQETQVFNQLLDLPEALEQEWIWFDDMSGGGPFSSSNRGTEHSHNRTVHLFKMKFQLLFDIMDAQDPFKPLQSFWDMIHPRLYTAAGWELPEGVFPRRAKYEQVQIVRLLTATEMTDFRSEVLWAATYDHRETMEFLLLQYPLAKCLAIKDTTGATPLGLATSNNHPEMMMYLARMQKFSMWRYHAGDPALEHVPPPHWSTVVHEVEKSGDDDDAGTAAEFAEFRQPVPQDVMDHYGVIVDQTAALVEKTHEEEVNASVSVEEDKWGSGEEDEMEVDG